MTDKAKRKEVLFQEGEGRQDGQTETRDLGYRNTN